MTPSTDRDRSIHRAHTVIREFVRSASSAAGEDPAALVALLRHTLPGHFAYEERAGGFLDRLQRQGAPVVLVDRLRGEHAEFLGLLEQLEGALAAGREVTGALHAIAKRLREHEWIESISAVQVGLQVPTDLACQTGLDGVLPGPVVSAIFAIVERIHEQTAATTDELLSGITVSLPDTLPVEVVRAAIEDALLERGLDFVDVVCRGDATGDLTLTEARFRRL